MCTRSSNRRHIILFNPFVGEKDEIEPAPSPHSPSRKDEPYLLKGVSFPGAEGKPRLRAKTESTVATTKQLINGVRRLIKAK